jgi:biofilm PGA synthesis N-glycosyltransferase PgaC
MLLVLSLGTLGMIMPLPPLLQMPGLLPNWYGAILGTVCVLQFVVSLAIDRRYEERVGRQIFWIIWYPLAFWLIGMLTTVVAVPKAFSKRSGMRAVWESPDRGIH